MNYCEIPIIDLKFDRYGRASATQVATVEIRIYYMRKAKWMSTRVRVFKHQWDAKHQRIINRADAIEINKLLEKMIVDVRKVINDMLEEGHIDLDAIPSRLSVKRKPKQTFLDFCRERAEFRKYGKAAGTKDAYDRFLRFLEEYEKILSFGDLTEAKIIELDRYLKNKGMKPGSRFQNYHHFLITFIGDAQREGQIQVNPYNRIRIEKGYDDYTRRFLLPDEFQKFREAKMPSERLERVRDLFIFQSYFCQGYSDLRKFSLKNIIEIDGEKVYIQPRTKSKAGYTVPLLPPIFELLKKYHNKMPMLSNDKYNDYLKEVSKEAGLDYPITTHWARHTGAMQLLNSGVEMGIVSKILGHKSIRHTEKTYAKYLPRTVVQSVKTIKPKII